ncbi:hypothetical protein D910_09180 [Dendroctonus ponderosae]|uniref:Mitochondrial carrier protein n=1 Tax=Dendroctonus ponderosae TaxID=77166 RepID=U4UPB7_DENPD|nr:hypothetical protein D910_09180 [Dendroctonus ponderosae]
MIGVACTFPTDLVKTRLQKQQIGPDGTKMYDGIKLSTARQGLAGALTGVVQLVVTVPMELLKIQLQDAGRVAAMEAKQSDAKFYWSFICALSTASCTAVMVTPSDIMKTRIQSISKGAAGDKTYGSVKDAFKDILQHEGIKGFYKGGACRILVLAPTYAIIQGIYFLGVAEKIFGLKRDIKVVK